MIRRYLSIKNLILDMQSWKLIKSHLKNNGNTDYNIKLFLNSIINEEENNDSFSNMLKLITSQEFGTKLDELDNIMPVDDNFLLFFNLNDVINFTRDNKYLYVRIAREFSKNKFPTSGYEFSNAFFNIFKELTDINLNSLDTYSLDRVRHIKKIEIGFLCDGNINPKCFNDKFTDLLIFMYAVEKSIDVEYVRQIFEGISLVNKGLSPTRVLLKYYDDESFNSLLYSIADNSLKDFIKYKKITDNRRWIVFFAVIMISYKRYDSSIVPYIEETFKESFNTGKDAIGGLKIILSQLPLSFSDLKATKGIPYAGVTKYWMRNYFDFCADIFEHNLLLQNDLKDSFIEDELKLVFQSIKDSSSDIGVSDEISITSKNKVYKLSKYTQKLIANEFEDWYPLTEIAKNCIKIISEMIDPPSSLYKDAYQSWLDKSEASYYQKKKASSIVYNPYYSIDKVSLNVYLNTNTMKLKDNYIIDNLYFTLNNDEKVIITNKNIKVIDNEVVGGFVIGSTRMMVTDPLNKVSYQLKSLNGESLYNSGQKMHREDLFFDVSTLKEVKPGKNYNGYVYLLTKSNVVDATLVDEKEYYNIYHMKISPKVTYKVGENIYSFRDMQSLLLDGNLMTNITYTHDGKEYPVYNHLYKLISDLDTSSDEYFIHDEVSKKNLYSGEDIKKLKMGLTLDHLSAGLYRLVIGNVKTKGKDKAIEGKYFLYDPNIHVNIEKIHGEIYKCLLETNDGYLQCDADDISTEYFEINKSYGNVDGTFKIKFNIPMISYDGVNWIDKFDRISFDDLEQSDYKLYFKGMDNPEICDEYTGQKLPCSYHDNLIYFNMKYFSNFSIKKEPRKLSIRNGLSNDVLLFLDYMTYFSRHNFKFYVSNNGTPTIEVNFTPQRETHLKIVLGETEKFDFTLYNNFKYEYHGMTPFSEYKITIYEPKGIMKPDILFHKRIQLMRKDSIVYRTFLFDSIIVEDFEGKEKKVRKLYDTKIKIVEKKYNDCFKAKMLCKPSYCLYIITDKEFENGLLEVTPNLRKDFLIYNAKSKTIDVGFGTFKSGTNNNYLIKRIILKLEGWDE